MLTVLVGTCETEKDTKVNKDILCQDHHDVHGIFKPKWTNKSQGVGQDI